MAERQLPKLNVAGSIPVSRSIKISALPSSSFDPSPHLAAGSCLQFNGNQRISRHFRHGKPGACAVVGKVELACVC